MRTGFFRQIVAFAMLVFFCSATFAQNSGFDVSRMDKGTMACDNFYQYTNGTWLKTTEIPPAFSSWGTWDILGTRIRENTRDILEAAAKNTQAAKGSSQQLIGDFYASCMDTDAIEAAGAKPLESRLKEIDAIKTRADVVNTLAAMHRRGQPALFQFFVFVDEKDSSKNIANANQGGLGLPTSEYYTKTDAKSEETRAQYRAHVARMFELAGDTPAAAQSNAGAVMLFETALAKSSKTPVELREPANYYNMMPLADVQKMMPNFSWDDYAAKLGTPKFTEINLGQPDYFKQITKMLTYIPVTDWKTYLRWNTINANAALLSKKFEDANFDFYSKTLSGAKEQQPRWRRCARAADGVLGEALGEEYVKTNFSPAHKQRMNELIDNLFASYKEHINKLDWMSEATRGQALTKLAAIKRKIGYPDKMRGYAGVTLDRKSYFDNMSRLAEFTTVRDLKDLGQAPDKTRWGYTPATLNAGYSSNYNDITFPAAILQPPFFDFKADEALNYGAIGSVIGHELTHGFDDSGSLYDGDGNLKTWWTEPDRKLFDAKADCVTTQFNAYEPEKGVFINGKLTLGENLADLGGIAIAYDALQKSMAGKPRPANIDGFTPEQRFFLGWGQVWSGKYRPELTRLLIQSDPHSIPEFRVNGPLSNLPEFSQAFGCKLGDKMAREKPCKVW